MAGKLPPPLRKDGGGDEPIGGQTDDDIVLVSLEDGITQTDELTTDSALLGRTGELVRIDEGTTDDATIGYRERETEGIVGLVLEQPTDGNAPLG